MDCWRGMQSGSVHLESLRSPIKDRASLSLCGDSRRAVSFCRLSFRRRGVTSSNQAHKARTPNRVILLCVI